MGSMVSRFISVVVITLDFDYVITFQQPRFEPGMDLFLHSRIPRRVARQVSHWDNSINYTDIGLEKYSTRPLDEKVCSS